MKKTEAIQLIQSLPDEDIVMALWQYSDLEPDTIGLGVSIFYNNKEELITILDDLEYVSLENLEDAVSDFINNKLEEEEDNE